MRIFGLEVKNPFKKKPVLYMSFSRMLAFKQRVRNVRKQGAREGVRKAAGRS